MNFEIRCATYRHDAWDIPNAIKLADRVSRKIHELDFHLTSNTGMHPWDAFNDLIWESTEGYTDYISDDSSILYDIGSALYGLDGEGYNGVADEISNKSTDSCFDVIYRIKPKYAKMVKDDMDELKMILSKQLSDIKEEESAEDDKNNKKKEAARSGVADIQVKSRVTVDEGGKIEANDYTITTHTGKVFTFTERNVFDFGRVINPTYAIAPGLTGGLCIKNETDGRLYWNTFDAPEGWRPVRPLDADEEAAYKAVSVLGRLANSNIRM